MADPASIAAGFRLIGAGFAAGFGMSGPGQSRPPRSAAERDARIAASERKAEDAPTEKQRRRWERSAAWLAGFDFPSSGGGEPPPDAEPPEAPPVLTDYPTLASIVWQGGRQSTNVEDRRTPKSRQEFERLLVRCLTDKDMAACKALCRKYNFGCHPVDYDRGLGVLSSPVPLPKGPGRRRAPRRIPAPSPPRRYPRRPLPKPPKFPRVPRELPKWPGSPRQTPRAPGGEPMGRGPSSGPGWRLPPWVKAANVIVLAADALKAAYELSYRIGMQRYENIREAEAERARPPRALPPVSSPQPLPPPSIPAQIPVLELPPELTPRPLPPVTAPRPLPPPSIPQPLPPTIPAPRPFTLPQIPSWVGLLPYALPRARPAIRRELLPSSPPLTGFEPGSVGSLQTELAPQPERCYSVCRKAPGRRRKRKKRRICYERKLS